MDLKGALLNVALLGVFLLAFGAWIAVDLGYTEPYLSMADVPGGSIGGMVAAIGAFVAGVVAVGYVKRHHESDQWTAAGRAAGLEPTGTDTPPELTGTVDGRPVPARVERRTRTVDPEGVTRRIPYTIVEADLRQPATHGLIAGRAGDRIEASDVGSLQLDAMVENHSVSSDIVAVAEAGLVVVGTTAAPVDTLASGPIGDALRANEHLNLVAVGNARRVVTEFAEAHNAEMEGLGSSLAEYPVDNLLERFPTDAGTVTIETQAFLQNGDALRGHADAAVTSADLFESATEPGSNETG